MVIRKLLFSLLMITNPIWTFEYMEKARAAISTRFHDARLLGSLLAGYQPLEGQLGSYAISTTSNPVHPVQPSTITQGHSDINIMIGSKAFKVTPDELHNFELLEELHKNLQPNQTLEIAENEFINHNSFKNLLSLLRSDYTLSLSEISDAIKLADFLSVKNPNELAKNVSSKVYIHLPPADKDHEDWIKKLDQTRPMIYTGVIDGSPCPRSGCYATFSPDCVFLDLVKLGTLQIYDQNNTPIGRKLKNVCNFRWCNMEKSTYAVTFGGGKYETHTEWSFDELKPLPKFLVHYILNESDRINGPVYLKPQYINELPKDVREILIYSGYLQNGFNWGRLYSIVSKVAIIKFFHKFGKINWNNIPDGEGFIHIQLG